MDFLILAQTCIFPLFFLSLKSFFFLISFKWMGDCYFVAVLYFNYLHIWLFDNFIYREGCPLKLVQHWNLRMLKVLL